MMDLEDLKRRLKNCIEVAGWEGTRDSDTLQEAADLIESLQAKVAELETQVRRKDVTIATISNALTYAESELSVSRMRVGELDNENRRLKLDVAAQQAEIDRLMLEYCPNEMTPEQIAEWGKHQRRAIPNPE